MSGRLARDFLLKPKGHQIERRRTKQAFQKKRLKTSKHF